ncbi:hypothetical protein [Luteimonas abyssi]|uniref:hypothetical protein n=1 Tax=Luteimonas abyssi TaxID=1247514 RepID=UPI000737C0D4|nr:hypothetical protein [Luteimonas abyssi]
MTPRDTTPHESDDSRHDGTPGKDDAADSGYAERQPRDHDDARHRGERRKPDPDQGGLDRTPGDDPDPAADGD